MIISRCVYTVVKMKSRLIKKIMKLLPLVYFGGVLWPIHQTLA